MKDKHVLITGASGGIGLETVKLFLSEGAKVTAHYNTTTPPLEGPKGYLFTAQADVREEEQVERMFKQATDQFGRVDVLVANAGIWPTTAVPIHELSYDQWRDVLDTNLTGYFLCLKHFFRNLVQFPQEMASVVFVGSTAGVFGEAGHADYASTKSAVVGLMLSAKNEIVQLARKGRVNTVHPGWTVTPMAEEALKDEKMVTKTLQTIALRKVAEAEDIGKAILALASDELSGHISGQAIVVSGGMEGRLLFGPTEIDVSRARG